ncbi:MAG: proprotein convertase P-domain-containing protein [Myxococcota bacterium]
MTLMVTGSCAQGISEGTTNATFGPGPVPTTGRPGTNDSTGFDFTTGGRPDGTDTITTRPPDPSTGSTGQVDTSSDTSGECGDGVADPGEECDRDDLLGLGCADVDPMFTGGTLSCTARCTFDTSRCGAAPNPIAQCSNPNALIPDDDPTGLTDTIVLPPEFLGGTITDVNIEVELDHTFIGDLVIDVSHAGTSTVLHNFCISEDNIHVLYDDQAGSEFDCGQSDLGLPVQPFGTLADLDDARVETDWTLFIEDQALQDVGTLTRWCVTISWM